MYETVFELSEGPWKGRPVQRRGEPISWTKWDGHIVRKVAIEWKKKVCRGEILCSERGKRY